MLNNSTYPFLQPCGYKFDISRQALPVDARLGGYMEKAIRRPIALMLSMPCTKFGLLKIHIDAKKGIYLAFTYKNASVCTRTYRRVAQNYQHADMILATKNACAMASLSGL